LTDPTGAAVTAREMEVRYARGGALAVSGVDLTVHAGSVLLVTGDPGCGKTSLLHGLLGLAPVAGGLNVLGYAPGHPDALRRTGLAPQGRPFDPRLTALETATLIAGLRSAPSGGVQAAFDAVGLTTPHTVTGRLDPENTRRLSLALALIGDPDLVMIDEPWEMPETVDVVISSRERGAAVILCSAEPGSLSDLAGTTLRLVEGRPG
jgi:ABC-2 type transport system ATP-binding protein